MMNRLRTLFTNVPSPAAWARLGIGLLLLLLLSWLLNLIGVAPWQADFTFLLGLGAVAGLGTSIGEEALFRGILLRPSAEGRSGLVPAALSSLAFTLWHPLQTFLYDPLWQLYAWRWWFLGGSALLGFGCARLTQRTRSLWPAILLHLMVALGWKTLYGIPSCGLAPCMVPN
ncbi:MAG TPA: CPBP family glutamic-type intramembrane protease [Allosphingosinicella sp.]